MISQLALKKYWQNVLATVVQIPCVDSLQLGLKKIPKKLLMLVSLHIF